MSKERLEIFPPCSERPPDAERLPETIEVGPKTKRKGKMLANNSRLLLHDIKPPEGLNRDPH